MLQQGYVVELVDERKTSRGLNRNQHSVSAIRIATLAGERIWEMVELQPTEGEVKELQRRSRIKSQGRVTISSDLARKVALGELTWRKQSTRSLDAYTIAFSPFAYKTMLPVEENGNCYTFCQL